MNSPVDHHGPSYSWRQTFRAALLWLGGCSVIGFVAASISGEHGSIIMFGFGVVIGITGAICHVALLSIGRFRSANRMSKAFLLGIATTALLLVCAEIEAALEPTPNVLAYTEALTTVLTFGLLPSLAAAFVAVWLTDNAA
jgi:hypothetical protein